MFLIPVTFYVVGKLSRRGGKKSNRRKKRAEKPWVTLSVKHWKRGSPLSSDKDEGGYFHGNQRRNRISAFLPAMTDCFGMYGCLPIIQHNREPIDEEDNMSAEKRLKEMGISLPATPKPVANYVPSVRVGNLLFVSGHGPYNDGKAMISGKLGKDLTVEEGYQTGRTSP